MRQICGPQFQPIKPLFKNQKSSRECLEEIKTCRKGVLTVSFVKVMHVMTMSASPAN
jgi:hypothetical protein